MSTSVSLSVRIRHSASLQVDSDYLLFLRPFVSLMLSLAFSSLRPFFTFVLGCLSS
jgi:hypothetical protein